MADKAQTRVLRIGIVHEGRIIEERLLRKRGDVTVGASPKCTFILPIANLPESYRLFVVQKGKYFLRFTAGMAGRVSVGERLWDLPELRESNLVQKSGQYFLLPLDDNSRGKLVFGEVSLLFQFVLPPPPVPKLELPATAKGGLLSRIDVPLFLAFMASLVLQAGGVAGVQYWWNVSGQFQVKKARRYSEVYEYLKAEVQRRVQIEKPKVDVTGPGTGSQEDKGAGGEEKKVEKEVARRPQRTGGDSVESAEERYRRKVAKVRNSTVIYHLGKYGIGPGTVVGAAVEGGVASSRLASAFETKGVETAGVGAPLSGFRAAPPGGGSEQATTYQKLGKEEIGSGRGVAQVAGGTKVEEVKLHIRGEGVRDVSGAGRLDKSAIESVFSSRQSAIKMCYQRSLKVNPNISGKVTIRFTIGEAGTVTDIYVLENTTGDPDVAACIVQKVRTWRFTPPEGGPVTVTMPLLLQKG